MEGPSVEGKIRPTGVFEALIAAGIGGGFLPAVTYAWSHFFHSEAPEWAKGALPNVAAAAVLIPSTWVFTRLISRTVSRRKRQTPRAKGDRLSIYVAHLGGDDPNETARASVIDSIRGVLGPQCVEVLPAGIELRLREGVSLEDAALDATREGRALLQHRRGDLLIWGRLHTLDQKTVIELRFVSANQSGVEGQRFGLTDKLTLDARFAPQMGVALSAVAAALAAPSVTDSGTYMARTLEPVARRLAPLIHSVQESLHPDDRGGMLFSYGLVQSTIGVQSGERTPLEEAVAAYREALKEYTRERVPLQWAMTQNNLGNALRSLGERESGTARLEEAVAAYREALKEYTRERVPLQWATTQNNLGNALGSLGERESGTARLEEAVAAYREALKERTRERVPLQWAMTQNNLGNALRSLGERESGTARLEEAVAAYREALKERTRERVPLQWAMTQNNLGNALRSLGERESGKARLEEAVAAFHEALKVLTGDTAPRYQSIVRAGLAKSTSLLDARR